ncbi:unnamed protein product [Symbiodinium sp. CCMP2592]|nr:unnamed protein product [Symbiodinium sp. CCMP2592]
MVWPRTEDPVEKSKLRNSFLDKLRFLDNKTKAGNTLEEKMKFLSPKDWEAVLDKNRALAAGVGLYVRPHLDLEAKPEPAEEQALVVVAESSVPQKEARPDPVEYARTDIFYLRTTGGQKGVFQVHKVQQQDASEGYVHIFRVNEACSVLQIRGCKPVLQQGALLVLETIISSSAPADLELNLLPKIPACKIVCQGSEVDLQSLEAFLGFMDWMPRWQKSGLLSPTQKKLQGGVRLPLLVFFILRAPLSDEVSEAKGDKFESDESKDVCSICCAKPWDGRALKKEVKLRNLMALDRFLNRSSGFASKAADQSLVEMGLQELSPSHYHRQVMHLCTGVAVPLAMKLVLPAARLSCDFAFRFFRRAATVLHEDRCNHTQAHKQNVNSWLQMLQELKEQRFRSLNLISDASPKARMDVWLPLVTVDRTMAPWVLQRLSDLLPSTASTETKMEECQRLADQAAQADSKQATARKLPKTISKIKQQRLSTREHLKAVIHSLDLLECELQPPKQTLAGARPQDHVVVEQYDNKWSFRCNTQSGESEWLCVDKKLLRLVLQGDQGGPLYSGYQYLAGKGFAVSFIRDESCLGFE